ncbi:uncharacterized protein LOC120783902 isoform X2 [Xiphias gladius]|uniref:uncharacterized protein LOC120783902 isoform X2 n=1 Tax=Xiphias gladius TaxID=8245 RepID=UPI001A993FF8|nr:uncharacterized protein LOC120783902 isoform X2 [Xiphias gladius]
MIEDMPHHRKKTAWVKASVKFLRIGCWTTSDVSANVNASTTMQKTIIFLLIIWNSSTFASGNSMYHLHFSLGCQAVIPCQHMRRDSNSFKWFYKKDEHDKKIQIFFQDRQGLRHRSVFHLRGSVIHNRSLVINKFTEDDQGLYWCENCYDNKCNSDHSTVIRVNKEILDEIHEIINVTVGSSFTHACPGEFTNLKWTFEASNLTALRTSGVRSKTDFVNTNKYIRIANVQRADAGKYTCWTRRCDRHRQKLLTINLCVVTGTLTIPRYLIPAIYGTSAALAFLILMALIIFYFRPRFQADFSDRPYGCCIYGREERTSVVYSSVVIRRAAQKTNNHMTYSDCLYSEINV